MTREVADTLAWNFGGASSRRRVTCASIIKTVYIRTHCLRLPIKLHEDVTDRLDSSPSSRINDCIGVTARLKSGLMKHTVISEVVRSCCSRRRNRGRFSLSDARGPQSPTLRSERSPVRPTIRSVHG